MRVSYFYPSKLYKNNWSKITAFFVNNDFHRLISLSGLWFPTWALSYIVLWSNLKIIYTQARQKKATKHLFIKITAICGHDHLHTQLKQIMTQSWGKVQNIRNNTDCRCNTIHYFLDQNCLRQDYFKVWEQIKIK